MYNWFLIFDYFAAQIYICSGAAVIKLIFFSTIISNDNIKHIADSLFLHHKIHLIVNIVQIHKKYSLSA